MQLADMRAVAGQSSCSVDLAPMNNEREYKHIGSPRKTKVGLIKRDTVINDNTRNHGMNFPVDLPIPAGTASWRRAHRFSMIR